jgi:hypothetical protein
MELSPKGILFARGRLNSPYAMRVRHYVDFDSLHRTDNGRHETNAPINLSRLAATIASAALGMSDPCTSEVPSPRGIESSLSTTQRLGAVTDGPPRRPAAHTHIVHRTPRTPKATGWARDVSFHSRTTRSVSDDSTIREPIAAFRMRTSPGPPLPGRVSSNRHRERTIPQFSGVTIQAQALLTRYVF